MGAFASLYHPEATVWTNFEAASHQLGEHLARVARVRGACSSWEYSDVECQRTDTGFVSEHTLRVRTGDGEFVTRAAIVARLGDGQITKLSEYLTKPRRA